MHIEYLCTRKGEIISMKIAMIGSGTAGSVFASYLRLGGADL